MKKRCIFVVLILVVSLCSACGKGKKEEITNLKNEVAEYEVKLAEAQKELDKKKEEVTSLEKQLDTFKTELENVSRESSSKESELQSLKEENTSLAQQVESANVSSDGQLLIDLIFPVDGKAYLGSPKVIFYKDIDLSQKIGTGDQIPFVSKEQKEVTADQEKGLKVWIARSESGLLFSANKPGIKESK